MNDTLKQETDSTYAKSLELMDALSPDQVYQAGACDGWCARDVVAHLNGWLVEGEALLIALRDDTYERKQYDFDAFNANSVAVRQHMAWAAVLDEFKRTHTALIALADSLPEEKWQDKRVHGWFTAVTSHHYPEHYEHLENAARL